MPYHGAMTRIHEIALSETCALRSDTTKSAMLKILL